MKKESDTKSGKNRRFPENEHLLTRFFSYSIERNSEEGIAIVWDSSFSQRNSENATKYLSILRELFCSQKKLSFSFVDIYLLSNTLELVESLGSANDTGKLTSLFYWVFFFYTRAFHETDCFLEIIFDVLRGVIYDGGTDFECLQTTNTGEIRNFFGDYDRVLMFTNGVASMSKPLMPFPCPAHIFSRYLRGRKEGRMGKGQRTQRSKGGRDEWMKG